MSSIPRNSQNENNVLDFVTNFIAEFHIGKLLFKSNAGKRKGDSGNGYLSLSILPPFF